MSDSFRRNSILTLLSTAPYGLLEYNNEYEDYSPDIWSDENDPALSQKFW